MIVYNVERGWFPMKNDAEAYRRKLGLKPAALATVRIESREELAAFLNGLMGLKAPEAEPPAGAVLEPKPEGVTPEVIERNYVEVPDCVPLFLAKELAKGREIRWVPTDEASLPPGPPPPRWERKKASSASSETNPGS